MSIVTVNVTQQVAPTPSTLQQKGALISQGGTTLSQGASSFLTQLSDLTALLASPAALSSLSWSGGTVTATTASISVSSGTYNNSTGLVTLTLASPHGLAVGAAIFITGINGTGSFASCNGSFVAAAGTTGTTLTYTIATGLTLTITSSTGSFYYPVGPSTSDTFLTTIAGATPSGYNGTYLATVTAANTFTFPLAANPGAETIPGTFTGRNSAELTAMATTFFAQGASIGVYVLELGAGEDNAAVAELSSYLTANPLNFYSYLVPKSWAINTNYLTLIGNYTSTTAKQYFFSTIGSTDYSHYPATLKSAVTTCPAPLTPVTEFTAAAVFWNTLVYAPSSTNKITPLAFAFTFGVTPWPTNGNGPTLTAFKTAGVNYIGTGAEGGISNTMIFWGTTMDVNPFTYWYSIDWMAINAELNVANAVMNGSNNPINPLYDDQNGVNRLQSVIVQTTVDAITFGLATGSVASAQLSGPDFDKALDADTYTGINVVNAVPWAVYYAANPGDFKLGRYAGFSVQYIPGRNFEAIVINLQATQFV